MKARGAAIQGGLALVTLTAAYATWQRQPEHSAAEAVVLEASKNDLTKVRYDEGAKWVELERKGSGSDAAIWLKFSAKEDAKPPVPERLVRGNESADKLWERFTPMRALRALGALEPAKLKELGFETAKKKVEVTARGDKRTFVIATAPTGGSAPYWKDERDGRVYVVESILSDLDSAQVRLVSRGLHTFKKTEFDAITVSASDKKRELVQTQPETPNAKLASKKDPNKTDEQAKNWHDKIFGASAVEVLGQGEKPAGGEPQLALKVEYFSHGKSVGFVELGRVPQVAPANTSAPAPTASDIYARTEHTAGWVKLPAIMEDLVKEADKIVAGE